VGLRRWRLLRISMAAGWSRDLIFLLGNAALEPRAVPPRPMATPTTMAMSTATTWASGRLSSVGLRRWLLLRLLLQISMAAGWSRDLIFSLGNVAWAPPAVPPRPMASGAAKTDGDADNDGDVDGDDLGFWEAQFGGFAPLAAASSQQSGGSGLASVVSSQQSVGSYEALVGAAIAVEWLRSGQVAEAPPLVEEPAFAETYADHVFADEATAQGGLFAEVYELPEANSGEADSAESPWLADELLERVFG